MATLETAAQAIRTSSRMGWVARGQHRTPKVASIAKDPAKGRSRRRDGAVGSLGRPLSVHFRYSTSEARFSPFDCFAIVW